MITVRTRVIIGLLSGIVLAFAFAPVQIFFLALFAPAMLIGVAMGASRRVAFGAGFLHGLAFYGISVPWVYLVMRQHGGLGVISAGGVFLLMVCACAAFPGTFAALLAHFDARDRKLALIAAPFLWVTLEFARAHLPDLGFPWDLLGYAGGVDRNLLLQLASFTGIYGVSFIVAALCALMAVLAVARGRLGIVQASVLAIGLSIGIMQPRWFLPEARATRVAYLVQPNLSERESYPANWMDLPDINLRNLEEISVHAVTQEAANASLAGQQHPRFIIWPEVPAPFYFADARFAETAQRVARDSGAYFLLGVVEWKQESQGRMDAFNSAVMLAPAGQRVFQYDKIHLVPYGEYVPFQSLLGFAQSLVQEVGGYKPGSTYAVGALPDEPGPAEFRTPGPPHTFGVFICYEAVFPNLVRRFTANGAELLINISNDGWYGRSWAPEQHLAMARVRAIENRRWMLRATNNGYTVSIDPYGRVVASLPADQRAVLRAPYDFSAAGDRTLYVRWGDWFAWLCVVVAAGAVLKSFLKVRGLRG